MNTAPDYLVYPTLRDEKTALLEVRISARLMSKLTAAAERKGEFWQTDGLTKKEAKAFAAAVRQGLADAPEDRPRAGRVDLRQFYHGPVHTAELSERDKVTVEKFLALLDKGAVSVRRAPFAD
jgi:hypothetical protein